MVQQHTASQTANTIWEPISEEHFMQTVSDVLSITKQMAGHLRTYDRPTYSQPAAQYVFPFNVEYQLAQDFAFLAA